MKKAKFKTYPVRNCIICGKEFEPHIWNQKTCCFECKMENDQQRYKRNSIKTEKRKKADSDES